MVPVGNDQGDDSNQQSFPKLPVSLIGLQKRFYGEYKNPLRLHLNTQDLESLGNLQPSYVSCIMI